MSIELARWDYARWLQGRLGEARHEISQTQDALRQIVAYCNGATVGSRDHLTAVADLRSIEAIAREALRGE